MGAARSFVPVLRDGHVRGRAGGGASGRGLLRAGAERRAAVLLSCYGNVPPERAAQLIGMLLGTEVSAGWVDKAAARVSAQLGKAGFDEAMLAALAAEDVLAADETPVSVLDGTAPPAPAAQEAPEAGEKERERDPEERQGKAAAGAPHVLITRTPGGRLTFLQAMAARRKAALAAGLPASFTGYLITDGYTGYQHLLSRLAGIQQCAAHVIRRCRAVTKLGPGGVQNWAGDVITILRDAHQAVEAARARGDTALDQQILDDLRERYDNAVTAGIIHSRRDWDGGGNHPGYALGTWLREYKEQVFLFTRVFAVSWTNNVSERGAKAAKRHQAVSGYWHSLATLARWCCLRSYLGTAAAHGITALDAISSAVTGKPWLPPTPRPRLTPLPGTPMNGHVPRPRSSCWLWAACRVPSGYEATRRAGVRLASGIQR